METAQERKTGGILGTIERVGNKLPHPFILFLYIIVILVVASAILAGMAFKCSTRQPRKRFTSRAC